MLAADRQKTSWQEDQRAAWSSLSPELFDPTLFLEFVKRWKSTVNIDLDALQRAWESLSPELLDHTIFPEIVKRCSLSRVHSIGVNIQKNLGCTDISQKCFLYRPREEVDSPSGFEITSGDKPEWDPLNDESLMAVYENLQCNDIGSHQTKKQIKNHKCKSVDIESFVEMPRSSKLRHIVDSCRIHQNNCNICIHGTPGTGKTLTVHWIGKQFSVHNNVRFVYVNAYTVTKGEVLRYLAKVIANTGCSTLEHILEQSRRRIMYILVIDEIDKLSDQDLAQFYHLCSTSNAWCVTIGITNVLNIMEHHVIRRMNHLGITPLNLRFDSYNGSDITNIIQKRLSNVSFKVFEDKALDYVGKVVNSRSGDARMGFKLAIDGVKRCRDRLSKYPEKTMLIKIHDVAQRSPELIKISIPQLLIIRTMYMSSSKQFDKSKMFELATAYNREKEKYKTWRSLKSCPVVELSVNDLITACDTLVCLQYLTEDKVKTKTFLRLSLSDDTAEALLKENRMIA